MDQQQPVEQTQAPELSKEDATLAMLVSRLPDAVCYIVVARLGDRIEMRHKGGLGDLMVMNKLVENDAFKKQFSVAK